MGAKEGRSDCDIALIAQAACGAQSLGLVFEVEAIARLDFDRGDALGNQCVQTGKGLRDKLIFAGFPERADGGNDAAAGTRDLFVG